MEVNKMPYYIYEEIADIKLNEYEAGYKEGYKDAKNEIKIKKQKI